MQGASADKCYTSSLLGFEEPKNIEPWIPREGWFEGVYPRYLCTPGKYHGIQL